ncbi:MAG: effector binding domain-containing protein [Bacillota bacterium]|nr:effector binding domain-containing protein [Bacillota bacterium]
MEMRLIERTEFAVCGDVVETSLETCESDLNKLWINFKKSRFYEEIQNTPNYNKGLFGLMWYTQDHRYCYLLGVEYNASSITQNSLCIKTIPAARFAVVSVPENMTIVEAWTSFFEKVLPDAGLVPDTEHGLYFEYYPNTESNSCELWTPVKEVK